MSEKRRRANALMMKYYSGMIDEGGWKTASGDIAVFNTKYRRNLKSLVVQLEPIQAGSGDPSPDNIRPISGRTGATVYHTGKNMTDYPALISYGCTEQPDGSLYAADAYMLANKVAYKSYSGDQITVTIRLKNNSDATARGIIPQIFYTDGTHNDAPITGIVDDYTTFTFTSNASKRVDYVQFTYGNRNALTWFYLQIELGAAATSYEPYTGTTYPVSWETEAGTVYGAELDVISGRLTVDRAAVTLENLVAADLTGFTAFSDFTRVDYFPMRDVAKPQTMFISDQFKSVSGLPTAAYQIGYSANATVTRCFISLPASFDTADKFLTEINRLQPQIVYELATPQTYQLTPQQIQTLIGENVIWSDAGPVSVEYWS